MTSAIGELKALSSALRQIVNDYPYGNFDYSKRFELLANRESAATKVSDSDGSRLIMKVLYQLYMLLLLNRHAKKVRL